MPTTVALRKPPGDSDIPDTLPEPLNRSSLNAAAPMQESERGSGNLKAAASNAETEGSRVQLPTSKLSMASSVQATNQKKALGATSTKNSAQSARSMKTVTARNVLFHAAEDGDLESIERGLLHDCDVNAQDYEGRTPLLLAVRNGHLPATRALLQAGANMEIATKHKATPLGLASWRGFLSIVNALLEARASVNNTEENMDGHRPPIVWAALGGKADAASLLLDAHADIDGNGVPPHPLVQAARHGHCEVVTLLLDRGASTAGPAAGEALIWSARNGYNNVCEILVAGHVDACYTDEQGVAPLMWAAARGHLAAVQCLTMAKAIIDHRTDEGRTPLMMAARGGYDDIVKHLLACGASLYIPLHELELCGDVERLGPTISVGISMLPPISLESFTRRLHPATAGTIIALGGKVGHLLLKGIFAEREVNMEGTHAIHNITLAYMHRRMNVACDPVMLADDETSYLLHERMERQFAPQAPMPWYCGARKVDVRFMQCVLPNIWDTSIIHALSTAPGKEVFEGPYAEAIISHAWADVTLLQFGKLALEAGTVTTLGLVAVYISDDYLEEMETVGNIPNRAVISLTVLWAMLLPYQAHSYGHEMYRHVVNPLSLLRFGGRVAIIAILLVLVWTLSSKSRDPVFFRAVAAAVSVSEWLILLDDLTALSTVGPAILPILTAMKDIWVMAVVLVLILLACIHAHILLTRVPLGESYLIVWVAGLIGEFDLDEFAGSSAWREDFDAPIKILLMLISFGVNLVLMNIFIGVVGTSYTEALSLAKSNFLRKRASVCIMHKLGLFRPFCDRPAQASSSLWVCTIKQYDECNFASMGGLWR